MLEEEVKNSSEAAADSTVSDMTHTQDLKDKQTSHVQVTIVNTKAESVKCDEDSRKDAAKTSEDSEVESVEKTSPTNPSSIRTDETLQSSSVESSEEKKTEIAPSSSVEDSAAQKPNKEVSPQKSVVGSSTDEKAIDERKSPEKTVVEEKSTENTVDDKNSPDKTVGEEKSPENNVAEKTSPVKTVPENKITEKLVDEENSLETPVVKKSPEKTVQSSIEEKLLSPKKSVESSCEKSTTEKSQTIVGEPSGDEKKSPVKLCHSEETAMEADSTDGDAAANVLKEAVVSDDDKVREHLKLLGEGKKAFANNDFLGAADSFGKAAELSRIVYGEFSEKNAETLFLYGATMLECWKSENTVLGENMKGKDEDEGYDDEEDDDDDDEEDVAEGVEGIEKMETDEAEAADLKMNGEAEAPTQNGQTKAEVQNGDVEENGERNGSVEKELQEEDPSSSNAEDKSEDKEDEDNYLRVAWEMLDLAKIIYHKVDDKKRLADTYMKLGEVAVESGHETATEEMKKCLALREILLEPHDRVIAETHFNIGVAYSVFKLFDEATKHFENAKEILQDKMKILKDLNTEESLKEFAEIESIIPELVEKIQDMADSKRDEMNKEKTASDDSNGCSSSAAASASTDTKPASNIAHLVKRKRKMEDIVAEKSSKLCRVEGDDSKTSSENPGV